MSVTNTQSRYGAVSQGIHWLTATLVIVLLISGKVGDIEAEQSNTLYFWHSSLGITVLLLVIARIIWRFVSPPPALPSTMPAFARMSARALHVLFYALLVALPLSGWLAASAEGGPIAFFGVTLPSATASAQGPAVGMEDEREGEGDEFWEETHEVLGNALLILAILHVLAALKHHFLDNDDVLRRMLPRLDVTRSVRPPGSVDNSSK
jgi:cytochrome b561